MVSGINFQEKIAAIIGEECNKISVGEYKSLSLGFGGRIFKPHKRDPFWFINEWMIGTYSAAWRIVCEEKILCGSKSLSDDSAELHSMVSALKLNPGKLVKIEMVSKFDIRVCFNNNLYVEFLCATSDDDEMIHIFGPDDFFARYSIHGGWLFGSRSKPIK